MPASRRRALAAGVLAVAASSIGAPAAASEESPHFDPEPAIPQALPIPSEWLPVDEAPRRAAVLLPGINKSMFSTDRDGVVVVSAENGAYTWFPLPGLTDAGFVGQPFVLSPDGTRVAYWTGRASGPAGAEALVVRTLDGETLARRAPRPGRRIQPSDLRWDGDDALVYAFRLPAGPRIPEREDDQPLFQDAPPERWDLTTGEVRRGDRDASELSRIVRLDGVGGFALAVSDSSERLAPLAFGDDQPSEVPDLPPVFDPMLIGVSERDVIGLNSGRLVRVDRQDGEIGDEDVEVVLRGGPSTRVSDVLGFSEPDVAVVRVDDFGGQDAGHQIRLVDLRRRQSSVAVRGAAIGLVSNPDFGLTAGPSFASDLWATPTANRSAPEEPIDRRAAARGLGRVGLVGLVIAGIVVVVRRTERRRI